MNFLSPGRLALLLVVLALAGLYAWLQRRRRHDAVRFSNLALLAEVAPPSPGWRRHVPAAAVALALGALVVAVAQPVRQVRVPKEAATVMMVIDVSASMDATDVSPSRLEAATAAAKTFVGDLPPQVRVGLVSFDRIARVVASPTVDHQKVLDGIDRLILGTGTATGEAIYTALDALAAANDTAGAAATEPGGSAIVLLSDGVPTVGRPVLGAAQDAADAGRADLDHRLRHRRRHGHRPGPARLRPRRPRHHGVGGRDHLRQVLQGGVGQGAAQRLQGHRHPGRVTRPSSATPAAPSSPWPSSPSSPPPGWP